MTPEEHQARHVALHQAFDELLADFIESTGALPSRTSLSALMHWSFEQTLSPQPAGKHKPMLPAAMVHGVN